LLASSAEGAKLAPRHLSVKTRRGEREVEEDRGGPVTRSRDASGRHPPKTVKPARKRELATTVCDDWGVSIRRACSVLEFDRPTYHYKSRRREQAGLEARIKEICATRIRYGYRRVHVLLRREVWEINLKAILHLPYLTQGV
jgi:hypothetical protein